MNITFSQLFTENSNKKSTRNFFDILDEKIIALKQKGINVIDLGVGDPAKTLGVPDYILNSLQKNYQSRKYAGYPGNKGLEGYLIAASNYLKSQHNINIDYKTQINITTGSKTAVSIIPRIFLEKGDLAICPTPGYPNFATGILLNHGDIYYTPLLKENNFLIDFDSIPTNIANKAKFIWINYPNSPTGAVLNKDYLKQLINWCHKYNIVLLSDEAYADIYFNDSHVSPLQITTEGVVAFYSMSKSFNLTSARVGFIAGDSKIISNFYKLSNLHDDGVPHIIQDLATEGLINSNNFLKDLRASYKQKKEIITSSLAEKFGCELPIHSNGSIFVWQKVPQGFNGSSFAEKLLNLGIAVMPGENFVGDNFHYIGENYIRIALIPQLEVIIEAANKIKIAKN